LNDSIKGGSTGVPQYNKRKFQQRRVKFEREMIYGDFSNKTQEPTEEQITLKKKREEKEAKLAARKYEKSHRGGFNKTKKGKAVAEQK